MSIFWNFLELHFSGPKYFIFYPKYQKIFLSSLFAQKKSYKNKVDFLTKTMGKRVCKMSILSNFLELHFSGPKKFIFYPEYQKMFLFSFFSEKSLIRKRSIFTQKPWSNPFGKCRFLQSFLALFFVGLKSIVFDPEYQKMFLSFLFAQKKSDKNKVDFLTKTMD